MILRQPNKAVVASGSITGVNRGICRVGLHLFSPNPSANLVSVDERVRGHLFSSSRKSLFPKGRSLLWHESFI
jgi:hypothetical protein